MNIPRFLCIFLCMACAWGARACTSLIATGAATADGRPILWKNRDTGARDNFLYRVEKPDCIGYVGLFNGGDSLVLDEAWQGMNDEGFAVMNTVAYNLPAPAPDRQDREGIVMARALEICRSVDDFATLLDTLPKPLGVQTNFGCIDARGGAAYFECSDSGYIRFDAADAPGGVIIRTNYAVSGIPDEGMGYVRYMNTEQQLREVIAEHRLTPEMLTEGISRSFYHALRGTCATDCNQQYIVDQDYVPRRSTTASIAVRGVNPGSPADSIVMYAIIGYPPVSPQYTVTLHRLPSEVLPQTGNAHAPAAERSVEAMKSVFPLHRGNGPKYICLPALRRLAFPQRKIE